MVYTKNARSVGLTVENILKEHGLFEKLKSGHAFALSLFPKCDAFMRLAIERHGTELTMTHYFEQNGDLVPDPDMTFKIEWMNDKLYLFAVTYQDQFRFDSARTDTSDKIFSIPKVNRLTEFAKMWAFNLRNQPYSKKDLVKALIR